MRRDRRNRNFAIFMDWLTGTSALELAEREGLNISRIYQIIDGAKARIGWTKTMTKQEAGMRCRRITNPSSCRAHSTEEMKRDLASEQRSKDYLYSFRARGAESWPLGDPNNPDDLDL